MSLALFLTALGRLSLKAGILVLFVLMIQWVFRCQLTSRWRSALWLLVVARLLLPVSFGSALSVFNLLPSLNEAAHVKTPFVRGIAPLIGAEGVPDQATILNLAVSASFPASQSQPDLPNLPPTPRLTSQTVSETVPTRKPAAAAIAVDPKRMVPRAFPWTVLAFGVWAAGALGLGAHLLVVSRRMARRFAPTYPIQDPKVLALLAECRKKMRLPGCVALAESAGITTPAIHGIFRPCLLLPVGCTFSLDELRFIFLHELAHVKRRDLPLNWLVAFLQVVHWFNPLLWLGFSRLHLDRELACDAMALEAAGPDQNKEYGRTVLRLLDSLTARPAVPGWVGVLEDRRQLQQRIRMIAAYAPGRQRSGLSMLLLAALGLGGLTDAKSQSPGTGKAVESRPATSVGQTHLIVTNRPLGPASLADVKSQSLGSSKAVEASIAARYFPSRPAVTNASAVKVTVLDAETSAPVADAELRARYGKDISDSAEHAPRRATDAAGVAIFRLDEILEPATRDKSCFTLEVRRTGYAPRGLMWSEEKDAVQSQGPGELTVRLQRGVTIGGMVRDESGVPQPDVRVQVCGEGNRFSLLRMGQQDYPLFSTASRVYPSLAADHEGRWNLTDYPRELAKASVRVTRTDGSRQEFELTAKPNATSGEGSFQERGGSGGLLDLLAGNAVLVVKRGFTVQGTVVDPQGKPVSGLVLKEGYGFMSVRQQGSELLTDAAGQFKLFNRTPRQMILTAYPDKFAITSAIVEVGSNTPAIRLQLDPVRPLRIQVRDAAGRPIPGAKVRVDDNYTEGQVLGFEATTDGDGRVVWTNAPHSSFSLTANSSTTNSLGQGAVDHQTMRVSPAQREVVFRLRPGVDEEVLVRVQARDAITGAPVVVTGVELKHDGFDEDFSLLQLVKGADFQVNLLASKFRGKQGTRFQLRFEAADHEDLVTPWRHFEEGDWDADLTFQPGTKPGGTVFLPDGQPAAGAKVSVSGRETLSILLRSPGHAYSNKRMQMVEADEKGRFVFRYPGGDWAVLIQHEQGFLATTADQLKKQPRLTLQPWGRVEGVLWAGTNVVPSARVFLRGPLEFSQWGFSFLGNTDNQGRFVFEKVPPGQNGLCRSFIPMRDLIKGDDPTVPVYLMPLRVKPGEVTHVNYGGTGRPIIGRVADQADWGNDDHLLVLKMPSDPSPDFSSEFATLEAFHKAGAAYVKQYMLRKSLEARVYPFRVEKDGSFRIDDVLAGTYELRIRLTEPSKQKELVRGRISSKVVASLTKEIVVPEMPGGRSDEPLDLGGLRLQPQDQASAAPAQR